MALTANPVPTSVQDAKLLPFHSNGKNESDMWDSYADNVSSHVHHGEDTLTGTPMGTVDHQQQQQQDKHYPASTSGLSRNASFDSVTSHDSCTASFSTGSPVTVLPPLQYTCSGTGMDNSPLNMSTHAGAWPNSFNSSNKRSSPSGLEPSEQQQQQQQHQQQQHQESIAVDSFWIGHDQMLLSEDCEPLLPSPVGTGTLSSMLNEFPFRYDDQACASNCNDYTSVNDLECLVPSSLRTNEPSHDQQQQQVVKSPESVGNSNAHSTSPGQQQQQQQSQQDFCQEFLVGGSEVYSEHNARRSDASLLSPPAARRRLSWSEYQVPEPQRHLATSEGLHFAGFGSQAYDHQQHFVPLGDSNAMAPLLPFRGSSCTVQDSGVGASVGGLKRPYSAMMMQPQQQQPASTCSISSSAPTLSHNSYLSKFPSVGPAAPKSAMSNMAPILSASHGSHHHQDAAALSALLYKTQGSSEMMQQLQQQQGQGTSSSDSAARQLPPPKLRRRHGTATDPQSIAARTRRERFSDRIRILQSLVPNGERLDTVSMLGHTLEYVRFLQHQVWQLYNGNDEPAVSADSESREKWKEFLDAQTVVA
ncbi:protein MpBHLH33 [Marchantia polymorpha subsp. ruderalis]|uniref:BHLH domain-containing protein n=2 Tax=Marchantia polymorpha TaxID=3197 RepID=A0AAF6AK72_MARPO|nr:hypothetical protein MARPO_0029s0135 [Marchantia polymorpha]BBM96842.1 hypothetical protein Mp_1g01110 [Marchantia polymorpha subsp. ruderalis]|eukprot:PTQ42641.1 hypothetical protein MARPO_0029s0135 [Marchantia polymorpha]